MNGYKHIAVILSVTILLPLASFKPLNMEGGCPQLFSPERQIRELFMNCSPPKTYHCLSTVNGSVKDICLPPSIIPAGHQLLVDGMTSQPKIEKCPFSTFAPSNRWSNDSVPFCEHVHSDCDDEGELEYHPGNETSDRICRCDYKKGYIESDYRERASVGFSKVSTDVRCYQFPCNGIRLQNYSCVDKCPEGMWYPNDSGNCQLFIINTNSKSTTISTISTTLNATTNDSTLFSTTYTTISPMERSDSILITVIVLVLISCVCLGLIWFLWKKFCQKKIARDARQTANIEQKFHHLTELIGTWWNLAKTLGLSDAEIQRIEADNSTSQKQCYSVLQTWKKKYAKADWVKELLQACQSAGVDHIDQVEAIFQEDAHLLTAENGNLQEDRDSSV